MNFSLVLVLVAITYFSNIFYVNSLGVNLMNKKLLFSLIFGSIVGWSSMASAQVPSLFIDDFSAPDPFDEDTEALPTSNNGTAEVEGTSGNPLADIDIFSDTNILGGDRTIILTRIDGIGDAEAELSAISEGSNTFFSISNETGTKSDVLIIYDGNLVQDTTRILGDINGFEPENEDDLIDTFEIFTNTLEGDLSDGLNLNLVEEIEQGVESIIISQLSNDQGGTSVSNSSITIGLISDSSSFSVSTVDLPVTIFDPDGTPITFDFDTFVPGNGATNGVNFSDVNIITLLFETTATGIDATFDFVASVGPSGEPVPEPTTIIGLLGFAGLGVLTKSRKKP